MSLVMQIIAVIVTLCLGYGFWLLKRNINYSMDYKDKVVETIQEQNSPLLERVKTLESEVKLLKGKK